jgi:hypothetical protein
VLREGGTALISIPFMFHIHGDPCDYSRFTSFMLEKLFSPFSQVSIYPYGGRLHVISDILTTAYRPLASLRILNHLFCLPIFNSASPDCPSGYIIHIKK